MINNDFFYKKLPAHSISLEELLSNERLFNPVPEEWHVIVVDVVKSTQAVKDGLHHQVNLAATGSIISILNQIKETYNQLRIPYFFGGDGATFLVPYSFINNAITVLENFRNHIKKSTSLILRVGSLPVKDIYDKERTIKIAKLCINSQMTLPVALGTGLKFAEDQIKSLFIDEPFNKELETPNLDGMECRWQEVEPPQTDEKILCLLASCPKDELHAVVYHAIIQKINTIFGAFHEHNPIVTSKLKLDATVKKISREMAVRVGRYNFWYLLKNWFFTFIGTSYFKYSSEGKKYLNDVSRNSYSFMIDGTLNNVIAGTQSQIDELVLFLDKLEADGKIKYGIHVTHGSILSCYVENRKSKHIHFVDGTEGGYTTAAKMYKAKFM